MATKIVLIGAGSIDFGKGQIVDILAAEDLRGRGIELVLVDIDQRALDTMMALAKRVADYVGSDIRLSAYTDRQVALKGANYVLAAVARKRMPLWEQDYRVPQSYGVRHILGENGGPGALFHSLRSLKLVIPICRDIETICPDAQFFNFTNPEARVLHAITHLTKVRATGFCHGFFAAEKVICRYLDRSPDDLEIISAGMNHFYTVLKVTDRQSGDDLTEEVFKRGLEDPQAPPLWRQMIEVFGLFSYPSDDHIGEYLAYGGDFGHGKWPYGRECRNIPLSGNELIFHAKPPVAPYASGETPLDDAFVEPSCEITVPIIADIELRRRMFRPSVNVQNTSGFVENLPRHAIVEVPAMVDGDGIHPMKVGPIPEPIAAIIRTHYAIHDLVTEAFHTGRKRPLLQALLLDPCIHSLHAARGILDDMLELQKDYLPELR
ncbi:MAG: hypothetical protein A2289_25775 [Deltaproteobacteria bacterium RIFOXYA12_FULL_58_15]|nr:MAG: hypothetical protein A2289_25775 [Deltaproteobacteria bacterium RIFOXYA12_FULL_58_15]OGR11225.1 MAG: hypothetical protein A2341_24915 [Deltaproteobacteria bacterium RIFOXYB12_FULL_58_9]